MNTIVCATCGKTHELTNVELAYILPDEIHAFGESERTARAKTSPDICMLDESRMFIRGLIPLSVDGREKPYRIGAWAEVAEGDFQKIYALWSDDKQAETPPFRGVLANEIAIAPSSRGLQVDLQLTGPRTRPEFYIKSAGHLLHREQTDGITEHRAIEYSDWRGWKDAG